MEKKYLFIKINEKIYNKIEYTINIIKTVGRKGSGCSCWALVCGREKKRNLLVCVNGDEGQSQQ
jgi:hypothetical protein